jgi:hypothetical protein
MITKFKKPVAASGTTIENEPIIKSDGASSDVMEWQASTGSSKVEIREDASNNLKLEVDGIPVASGLAGIDGTGLHFDGAAGTYVDCGDTTILDGATQISVEAIFSTTNTSGDVLISKEWTDFCFKLFFDASGTIKFNLGNGIGNATAETSGTYNDGTPKHIVATWDNATLSIYINGNLDGTASQPGGSIPNTADKLALGAYLKADGSNSNNLDGILYRARLWNKSLSQAEVTASYENATVPFADQYGVTGILTATDFTSASGWALETGTAFDAGNNQIDLASTGNGYGFHKTKTATKVGQIYRTTMVVSNFSSGSVAVRVGDMFGTNRGSNGTFTEYITVTTAANALFGAQAKAAGTTLSVDSITTDLVGCVADYDLAFANPTQSLMVQDRAGAADGTSSATGVSQVTPLEQVNTNKLNVGGVTPLVGIGLAAGVTPAHQLEVAGAAPTVRITDTNDGVGVGQDIGTLEFYGSDGSSSGADVRASVYSESEVAAGNAYSLKFTTSTGNAAPTDKLTIDSTGLVNVTSGGGSNLPGKLRLSNTAGTITAGSSLGEIEFYSGDASAGGPYVSASIVGKQEDTNPTTGALAFNVGQNNVEALTISSAGLSHFTTNVAGDTEVIRVENLTASQNAWISLYRSGTENGRLSTAYDQLTLQAQNGKDVKIIDDGGNGLTVAEGGLATFSNGIAFQSATTGSGTGTGYTLDAYEYGTWTPTATGGLTVTNAQYVKIGKQVTVSAHVVADAATSGNWAGLPFTASPTAMSSGAVGYQNEEASAVWSVLDDGTTNFTLRNGTTQKQLSTGKNVRFTLTYFTA